jgi:hypothetical protein
VAARRQDPLGLLKLLNPMKWPPRLKLLKDAFKPTTATRSDCAPDNLNAHRLGDCP